MGVRVIRSAKGRLQLRGLPENHDAGACNAARREALAWLQDFDTRTGLRLKQLSARIVADAKPVTDAVVLRHYFECLSDAAKVTPELWAAGLTFIRVQLYRVTAMDDMYLCWGGNIDLTLTRPALEAAGLLPIARPDPIILGRIQDELEQLFGAVDAILIQADIAAPSAHQRLAAQLRLKASATRHKKLFSD